MAFLNLARYTTTGTGTGTLSLTAVSGYAPTVADGNYRYFVIDTTNNTREWGVGAVASMVLTRTTVQGGSNGTSAVNLSAGTKEIVFGPSATDLDSFAGAVTDLAAHLADTSDAHDASAISFPPTGSIAADNVEAAIVEVASDAATALSAGLAGKANSTHSHAISDTTGLQTALDAKATPSDITSAVATHTSDTTDVHGIADTSTLITTSAIGVTVQAYSAVLAATTASFTTDDETKLDGIEANATADMTAAEILTAIKTVDGTGSGLDADLLDGLSSAAFATAAHDHSGTYQPLDADLTALAELSGTNTIYYRSGAGTWSAVTIGTNLTFSGGTLSASGGGGGGSGDLVSTNNLSDVASASTSLSNLGGQPLSAKLTSIAGLDPATQPGKAITAVGGGDDFQLSTVAVPPFAQSDVTGLETALSDLASDISDVASDVAGKADATHSHAISDITGLQAILDTIAPGLTLGDLETASATMVVGEITPYDLDGASADFTSTFPATIAAGDRFGALVNREKSSNTWGVKFADNGNTFRGSGDDIASVFLCYTGELIVFRVVKAPGETTGGDDTVVIESRTPVHGPLFTTLMDSDSGSFTAHVTMSSTSGGYGNDQKYANDASTKHGTWSFADCPPGQYKVWVNWSGDGNRSTSVRYVIGGPNTTSVTVSGISQVMTSSGQTDPNVSGITWYELTNNFQLRGRGALTVEVHNDSSGYVISDGCRIERIGPLSY